MTNEPSPRPWRVVTYEEDGDQCDIYDANGTPVCTMGYIADQPEADAALIVDAVNERERLRDLVRRLLPLAETTVENIRALGTARFPFMEQTKSDRLRGDINREVENADYLLREARAALGEGETPTGKGVGV